MADIERLRSKVAQLGSKLEDQTKAVDDSYASTVKIFTNIIDLYQKYCSCEKQIFHKNSISGSLDADLLQDLEGKLLGANELAELNFKNNHDNYFIKDINRLKMHISEEAGKYHIRLFEHFDSPASPFEVNYNFSNDGERTRQYTALINAMVFISEKLVSHLEKDAEKNNLGEGVKDFLSILDEAFSAWKGNEDSKTGKI